MAASLIALLAVMSAPGGVLAYVAEDGSGGRRVMVAELDAGSSQSVGPGKGDGAPCWSASGEWLAFETDIDGGRGIGVARADGTGFRIVTPPMDTCLSPAWSPEGLRIAYTRVVPGSDAPAQTLVVFALESGTTEPWGGNRTGLLRPRWMPAEMLLAAAARAPLESMDASLLDKESANGGVWCVSLLQTEQGLRSEPVLATRSQVLPLLRLLSQDVDSYVVWQAEPHSSGVRVAFESNDGGDREIFVLTDKGVVDVSNHRAADWNPVWAPRKRELAFESFRGGSRGIYRVQVDTARVAAVDADAAYDCWAPAWSPAGDHLAYVSDRTGKAEIYVKAVKGGDSTSLSSLIGDADKAVARLAPAWQPAPPEQVP